MKPTVKSKLAELIVGNFYLAYSSQSKMLSSNGRGGVIVQLLSIKDGKPEIKVWLDSGKTRTMSIARLDERKDTFMVPVTKELLENIKIKIGNEGNFAWPKFTERMKKAKEADVDVKFLGVMQPNERYPEDRIDGTLTFMLETQHDNTITYLNNYQISISEDMLKRVCDAEELEERKIQAIKDKIEKMKEGGVRLTVGKMEFGQKMLPELEGYRNEFSQKAIKYTNNCATFSVLIGDGEAVKRTYNYYDAPCHAAIIPHLKDKEERMFIMSTFFNEYRNEQAAHLKDLGVVDEWADYLINRSPYADLFVDKDVESVKKFGYLINCNAPANAISAALTATRQAWEYPQRVAAWSLLRKSVDENVAYVVCMYASGKISKDGLSSLSWNNTGTAHTPIDSAHLSESGVLSYMFSQVYNVNPYLSKSECYRRPHTVHSLHECDKKPECNSLIKNIKNIKVVNNAPVSDNPFDIRKSPVDASIESAIKVIKAWLNKYGL